MSASPPSARHDPSRFCAKAAMAVSPQGQQPSIFAASETGKRHVPHSGLPWKCDPLANLHRLRQLPPLRCLARSQCHSETSAWARLRPRPDTALRCRSWKKSNAWATALCATHQCEIKTTMVYDIIRPARMIQAAYPSCRMLPPVWAIPMPTARRAWVPEDFGYFSVEPGSRRLVRWYKIRLVPTN